MAQLAEHPTVKHFYEANVDRAETSLPQVVDAAWLRRICLDAGADDVGFVERGRPEIADQEADIESVFPKTRTLISLVMRMNRENIRTPARSISNLEFHHTTDEANAVARRIVSALEKLGIGAINGGAAGFPMEADHWGSKMWVISHKPVAVAAGLGQMGIHRNVIHPKFGNFILLGTVLIAVEATAYDQPLSYNPCLECKLCVAACPVGAIAPDGHFNFSACYTHNYREFMAASPIGSSRSPTARTPWTTAGVSQTPNRRRCGKAFPSGPTTRRRTAWPSARRGKRSSAPTSPTSPGTCGIPCARCRTRRRRSTSCPA